MKRIGPPMKWTAFAGIAFFILGVALFSGSPAMAATQVYQYTTSCADCHGSPGDMRPIDEAFRNITTGGFRGSHRTHMALTTDKNTCVRCHSGAGGYTTGHMNDQVDMSANINTSPGTATYSKATGPIFFTWTSNQSNMGTCSNVNCHFQKVTPTWSGTQFQYTDPGNNDCAQCHGAPPSGANGTAGSHGKHDTYFTGTAQCKKCHTDHLAESNKFSHATSVTTRGINIELHDPADQAGGSYSGTGAYFLPSQNGSQVFGNCSNLYCHSQGKSSSTFTGSNAAKNTPTWGGTLPADCSGCHGGNLSSGGFNSMSSGKHAKHINNAANVGRNIGCEECHNATTTNGTSIASTANHVNKSVNIKFNDSGVNKNAYGPTYDGGSTTGASGLAKASGSALGAGCSNIYCHSDGQPAGATRTYRTIAWNAAPLGCNGCHGTSTTGYPDHANAGAGQPGSNSHTTHAGAGYAFNCVKCHSGTTTDGASVIPGGAHLNGTQNVGGTDVAFDALNPSGSYAGQTCSTTYCHSNGNGANVNDPVWGSSMPATCTGCHGNNAASGTPIATNKHSKHVNNAAFLGAGNNFSCVECHAATVSDDRTIADKTRHVNGFKDFTGARAYKTGYTSGSTTASCTTYCHSSGQATPVYRSMTGSKIWGGSASLGCKGCHGYDQTPIAEFNSVVGEPNYTNGGAGTATANTHQTHVAERNIVDSRGCADCHRTTVDRGIAGKLKDYSSAHLNAKRDINFVAYLGYSGNYNPATKTCSNTYCHASSSPQWGNNVPITCDFCHKASNVMPGAHSLHWETATVAPAGSYTATPGNTIAAGNTQYQFVCSSCHGSPAQHAAGPVSNYRAAQVYFGYTAPGRIGSYTDGGSSVGSDGSLQFTNGGSCTTTYCHSNGSGGNGRVAVTWNTTNHTADKNVRCSTCHNYTQASTNPMASGKHTKHITTYTFGCVECHAATVDSSNTIIDTSKHLNKTKDVAWSTMNSGGTGYAGSSTTCSNIYCHSQGNKAASPYSTPKDTTLTWSSGTSACNSCHAGTSTGPDYSNGSPKANTHNEHVAIMGYTCVTCHNTVVDGSNTIINRALHVNKAYNVAGANFTLANTPDPGTPAQCSNISCHGGNNATWGGAALDCNTCHLKNVASVKNFNLYNGTLAVIGSAEWTNTGHGRTSGNYASGNPAANFNGCYYCHSLGVPHKSGTNNVFRLIQANYSTVSYGRNAVCLVCHAATGSTGVNPGSGNINATRKVSATHYGAKHGGGSGGYFCWDCHDPHGDGNDYMISHSVAKVSDRATGLPTTTVTVNFTLSNPPTGYDYAGLTDGICTACHTTTAHYAGDNTDNHNIDSRCTTCHSHSNSYALYAFKPSANCDSCHGYPPVRRGLVKYTNFGSQGNYSSARFEDYSGGGGAHTIQRHVPASARPDEGWANCAVCHSNGDMSPLTHTMVTPVTPSKITIDVKDSKKFDYRRTLGSERYSGKLTDRVGGSNTNATGSCSNVKCHFQPSKKWSSEK